MTTITRRDWMRAAGLGLVAATGGRALGRDDKPAAPVGKGMTEAAKRLLDGLTKEQRAKVAFADDSAERFNWHFVPLNDTAKKASTRTGVSLDDLGADAKTATLDLLKGVTGADGFKWCRTVMEREAILAELEPNNAWFRKPGWYFVTVYGTPAATGKWGWRLDGHHLSANVTVVDGEVVSAAPFFIGLNPVTIKHGKRQGERDTITPAEDLARDLFKALDPDQQKVALQPKHLPEVAGKTVAAPADLPAGLSAAKMTAAQRKLLLSLVGHYTGRLAAPLADAETARLTKAGEDRLTFAYTGEAEAGKRHTYAVQGPTLFIHYMNEMTDPQKNPANHIHSVFRTLDRDFGGVKKG